MLPLVIAALNLCVLCGPSPAPSPAPLSNVEIHRRLIGLWFHDALGREASPQDCTSMGEHVDIGILAVAKLIVTSPEGRRHMFALLSTELLGAVDLRLLQQFDTCAPGTTARDRARVLILTSPAFHAKCGAGRADVHIASGAFDEYMLIIDLRPGWEDAFFKKRGFRSALVETVMPLAKALHERGWKTAASEPEFELLVAP